MAEQVEQAKAALQETIAARLKTPSIATVCLRVVAAGLDFFQGSVGATANRRQTLRCSRLLWMASRSRSRWPFPIPLLCCGSAAALTASALASSLAGKEAPEGWLRQRNLSRKKQPPGALSKAAPERRIGLQRPARPSGIDSTTVSV